MNIKRAFLTAVATLMVPGFALAQTTISFDTVLELVPAGPYTETVTATLTCNTGNPLQQSFEIGPTTEDKVVFVVDNFNLDDFISCEITATSLSGYILLAASANGTELEESCLYADVPVVDESVALIEGLNSCVFTMAPAPFTYEIEKLWDFADNVDVSQVFSGSWSCTNALTGPDDATPETETGFFNGIGDSTFLVTSLHPNPWAGVIGGVTTCTAMESAVDSSVESDQGCAGSTTFSVGDGTKGCTITNSVFFEGIPTLSQYGLAVMALLMLSLGFVGFRRFV